MPLSATAAGIIGTIGSSAINMFSQARTNAQNRQMASEAYNRELSATREMNAYNSPSMQVARLRAAGLSPSLAYGANGEAVGNQSAVPAFSSIPAEAPRSGDLGAPFMDAARFGLEAREQLNRDNLAVAEIALQNSQSYLAVIQSGLAEAQTQEIVELLGYNKDLLASQSSLNWEKVLQVRKEMQFTDEQIKKIQSDISLNDAQIDELAARAGLSRTQAYVIASRLPYEIASLRADAFLAYAQSDKARQEITAIARDISHIQFVEDMENRRFDFDKASKVADIELERYEAKVGVMNHLQDNIARIIGFGVGAATVREGGYMPPKQVRNSVGHYGTGQASPASAPRTNARGERLGR